MLKILGRSSSINVRKVLWLCVEIGIPFEQEQWGSEFRSTDAPEFLELNPNALVPVIRDGDFVLWESNAILQYAADKFGKSAYYPTDLKTRADINRWLLWESSSWFPSCYAYLVENCVKPLLNAEPDAAVLEAQAANFHKLAGILDSRLAKSPWIAGAGPTIADIAIAAPMHLHALQKLPLDEHPNLKRWMTDRVEKLPCWEKTWVGPGFTLDRAAA